MVQSKLFPNFSMFQSEITLFDESLETLQNHVWPN